MNNIIIGIIVVIFFPFLSTSNWTFSKKKKYIELDRSELKWIKLNRSRPNGLKWTEWTR